MHNVAQLRRLRERFPNELVVIGVHSAKFPSEQLTANIREAVQRLDIEHPVVNDAGFRIWHSYNVHAWPTVVLIDPRGEIIGTQPGEIDAEQFIPIIEKIVDQYAPAGVLDPSPLNFEAEAIVPSGLLRFPAKLLSTGDGRLFVADTGHHRILELQLDPDGMAAEILSVSGTGHPALRDGPASEAAFNHPHGMALVGETLYVADTDSHAIRAIDLQARMVRTVAGTGEVGRFREAGGHPTQIPLRSPWALLAVEDATEEGQAVLFIAMAGTHQIWILLGEERLGVFAGNGREALTDGPPAEASFNQPSDLVLGMGHLIVADAEASAIRAIFLGEEPRVFTLIGQGLFEFGDIDGRGPEVRLQHPAGLAFSPESNFIYIADSYNHKIKRLDPTTAEVQTLIGTGKPGNTTGPFEDAGLYQPEGLALYNGKLYIADTNNHRICIADLQGRTLHTLALRGAEPLLAEDATGDAQFTEGGLDRIEPVTAAPGQVKFRFDFQLPSGHKLNPESPVRISIIETGEDSPEWTFPYGEPVEIQLEVDADRELILELSLYYCQTDDARLCLIHDRRVVLPVKVQTGAPSQVNVAYPVYLEG